MTLQRKFILAAIAIAAPLAALALFSVWAVMGPSHQALLERESRARAVAVLGVVRREAVTLSANVQDMAAVGMLRRALATGDAGSLRELTDPARLARRGYAEISVYGPDGAGLAAGRRPAEAGPAILPPRLGALDLGPPDADGVRMRTLFRDGRLILIAAAPVGGQGVLAKVRTLGAAEMTQIGDRFGVAMQLVDPRYAPPAARAATPRQPAILTATHGLDHVFVPVREAGGATVAYVRVANPRTIVTTGEKTMLAVFLAFILAAAAAVALFQVVVRRWALVPLTRLERAATLARETGRYAPPRLRDPDDEIGRLSQAFAHLLTEVETRERALQAARDKAQAAVKARSEFLATVSHEIRTPLNAVLGIAHILRREERDPERQRMGQTIIDSGELLLHILNDVLDMSKIEAGKLEVAPVDFNIADLRTDAEALWRSKAQEKGLAYAIVCDPALPARTRGDVMRIRQVMFNLIGNAIKFTDRGGVSVRLGGDAQRLRIEVEDTGCGVAPAQIDRLFAPFEQAGAQAGRTNGGTGLGLAIARRLCELMGGTIGARSVPGRGSTFWAELPLAPPTTADAGDVFELDDLPDVTALRVLVAEDNPTNRLVAQKLLETWGCRLTFAEDGAQALARAGAEAFDLILMDLQMPVLDGLAAARAIRDGGGPNAATPIVALTANASPEDQAACRAAGMSGFIAKPIRPKTLEAVVRAARAQTVDVSAAA